MSTHKVVDLRRRQKLFRHGWRTAAIALLASGASGLYWQAVYLPSQRSEAMSLQLEALTESVEQLEALLQPDSSKVEPSNSISTKVIETLPQSYWVSVVDGEIVLSPQTLPELAEADPETALSAAFETLLNGPKTDSEATTAIPSGTQLLNLKVMPDAIYIDLSSEFSQGGGSSSMISRVAQVLYTATSLEPTASIFLSMDGQLLDNAHPLGGEGLMLSQPLSRAQFIKDFPPNRLKAVED